MERKRQEVCIQLNLTVKREEEKKLLEYKPLLDSV